MSKIKRKGVQYAVDRLSGMPAERVDYVVEFLGDCEERFRPRAFRWAINALAWLRRKVGYDLDPEDDRVLIWEVLETGHKKVVWHFSGWHWDALEFWKLDQGRYPAERRSIYVHAMQDHESDGACEEDFDDGIRRELEATVDR